MAYKQHFIEWFSGSDISSIWTKTNTVGTGTFAMNDSVDGGYGITVSGTANNRSSINFNNKRQYNQDACEFIGVVQAETVGNTMFFGLSSGLDPFTTAGHSGAYYNNSTGAGAQSFGSCDGTTQSGTAFGTETASWQSIKIALDGTDLKGYVNGTLQVTKSTNYPIVKMQPIMQIRTYDEATVTASTRYIEAYNT